MEIRGNMHRFKIGDIVRILHYPKIEGSNIAKITDLQDNLRYELENETAFFSDYNEDSLEELTLLDIEMLRVNLANI